jgi:pyroglutamyl-peptidase
MAPPLRRLAPIVLLTGFEPFGGDACNPSGEIATRLDGWKVGADRPGTREGSGPVLATVRSVLLPCVFHQALEVLDAAIALRRPSVVIALGLAASRRDISVERVAINIDDARIPDNAGCRPIDQPIIAGAPCAYWSTLPIKSIVAAMQEAGIAASVSQSAGTFVCNHVFFGLAHRLAGVAAAAPSSSEGARPVRGGFIHVPWPADFPGAAPMAAGPMTAGLVDGLKETGAMELTTMIAAIRIAVWTTLTAGASDLQLPGGSLD